MTVLDGMVQDPSSILMSVYGQEIFWQRCLNILESRGKISIGDLYFTGSRKISQEILRGIEWRYGKLGVFIVPNRNNPEEVRF